MEKIYQRFLVTRYTPFPRHSAGREQWLMFFTSSELYPVGWEKAKPRICSSAELFLQVKTPIMAHVLHRVLNKEWELWVPLIITGLQKDKGQIYTAGRLCPILRARGSLSHTEQHMIPISACTTVPSVTSFNHKPSLFFFKYKIGLLRKNVLAFLLYHKSNNTTSTCQMSYQVSLHFNCFIVVTPIQLKDVKTSQYNKEKKSMQELCISLLWRVIFLHYNSFFQDGNALSFLSFWQLKIQNVQGWLTPLEPSFNFCGLLSLPA